MSTVIESFIQAYDKEFDYYEIVSRTTAQKLENLLAETGVRAIVTYRAKNPSHLKEKLYQRQTTKNITYKTHEEIYADIWDLAGVRVALYFPSDREKIETIINSNFDLASTPKRFPDNSKEPSYKKRFSGYWAYHYRVHLKPESLLPSQRRYSQAKIEIQVASVLMHAWSEVEHDLVYKPVNGELSEEEYSILDELNGLILAGEIALERLQAAGNDRVTKNRAFNNQYEVAAYLYNKFLPKVKDVTELNIGNIDLLYKLMKKSGIENFTELNKYIKNVNTQNIQSISSQIIDNIIEGDEEKYNELSKLIKSRTAISSELNSEIGNFITYWIRLEQLTDKLSEEKGMNPRNKYSINNLKQFLSSKDIYLLLEIRSFRNRIVHGIKQPTLLELKDMTDNTRRIIEVLESKV